MNGLKADCTVHTSVHSPTSQDLNILLVYIILRVRSLKIINRAIQMISCAVNESCISGTHIGVLKNGSGFKMRIYSDVLLWGEGGIKRWNNTYKGIFFCACCVVPLLRICEWRKSIHFFCLLGRIYVSNLMFMALVWKVLHVYSSDNTSVKYVFSK